MINIWYGNLLFLFSLFKCQTYTFQVDRTSRRSTYEATNLHGSTSFFGCLLQKTKQRCFAQCAGNVRHAPRQSTMLQHPSWRAAPTSSGRPSWSTWNRRSTWGHQLCRQHRRQRSGRPLQRRFWPPRRSTGCVVCFDRATPWQNTHGLTQTTSGCANWMKRRAWMLGRATGMTSRRRNSRTTSQRLPGRRSAMPHRQPSSWQWFPTDLPTQQHWRLRWFTSAMPIVGPLQSTLQDMSTAREQMPPKSSEPSRLQWRGLAWRTGTRSSSVSEVTEQVSWSAKTTVIALLRHLQPAVQGIHCAAHRMELAYKDAMRKQPLHMKIEGLMMGLYLFYKKSPLNMSMLLHT